MKRCCRCKVEKDITCFWKARNEKDGHSYKCIDCAKKLINEYRIRPEVKVKNRITREKYYSDPVKYAKWEKWQRDNKRLKKTGCKPQLYEDLFKAQNGKCSLCKTDQAALSKELAVDHNHTTGVIRGLLCSNCNTALGLLKDNLTVISRIPEYLA